ncbi:MAG: transcriptional repressor [Acholeplasmatales bacterium]|jgi:Fur family ferric uptake transcriptional regulator/Fur family peroxide stress response transcriptional regulator|nr:transcriptional repressor [Acholeplasmatales bacterium]
MNRYVKERYFRELKSNGLRVTKARMRLIEALEEKPLSFKELCEVIFKKGSTNLASIYNNINFFVEQNVILQVEIKNEKYYELILDKPYRDSIDHIHLVDSESKLIDEIYAPEIVEFIRKYDELKDIDISNIKIIITTKK